MSLEELVDAANRPLTNRYRNKVINAARGSTARFELYHAAPSLCSMKVRTVLAEKGVPYISHDLNIMTRKGPPECYLPGYVRLRLAGAPDAPMARNYTGQSSLTTEGFDPCVVPTLVDHEQARVVVDSARICTYLDEETPGETLVPPQLSNEVGSQIAMVDQAPHVAVLYGANPDGDRRPRFVSKNITGVHARKIEVLEELKAQVSGEPDLITAYDSKISKESHAGEFVYDAERMRAVHAAMNRHVEALEDQLASRQGSWVLGERYTLADIMWTVSLYRMKWLGLGDAWERGRCPRVSAYLERAFARPSFHSAVIDWPFAYAPSPHVAEFSGLAALARFFLEIIKRGG